MRLPSKLGSSELFTGSKISDDDIGENEPLYLLPIQVIVAGFYH